MSRGLLAGIVAGIVAGAIFLVFLVLLNLSWIVALVVAIVGYGGALLLLSDARGRRTTVVYPQGITAETVNRAIEEGRAQVQEIRRSAAAVPKADVRQKIEALCASAERIFDDLPKDPKDVPAARQFLTYYLDATGKIVRRYSELASVPAKSTQIKDTLAKVESSFDLIQLAFDRQLSRLLQDDVLDLDSEIALLEKTISMENLLDEK